MPDTAHYYILAERGQYETGVILPAVGDSDDPVDIVTDPRKLQASEIVYDLSPADLVLDGDDELAEYRLVRLTPRGPVIAAGQYHDCADGWRVDGEDPVDGLLGPQAEQIRAAILEAEQHLAGTADDDAAEAAYAAAIDALPDGVLDKARDAARRALDTAGADGWLWETGFSHAYGYEIIAVAARDLTDPKSDWNQAAYDLLTGPWLAAFGEPIHPGDSKPAAAG